jgi:hypothetical protein
MRTSVDFPDDLMKHLKHLSLERDQSLRALLLDLIDKGLASERSESTAPVKKRSFVSPPIIKGRSAMRLSVDQLTNAGLYELLDQNINS